MGFFAILFANARFSGLICRCDTNVETRDSIDSPRTIKTISTMYGRYSIWEHLLGEKYPTKYPICNHS